MRQLILIISLVGIACLSVAQTRDLNAALVKEASDAYDAKDYARSLKFYHELFEMWGGNPTDLYNAACSAALLKEKQTAFKYLDAAVLHGYENYDHILRDEDLFSLHPDDEWKQVLRRVAKNHEGGSVEFKLMQKLQKNLLIDDPSGLRAMGTEDFIRANSEQDLKNVIASVKSCLNKYKLTDFGKFSSPASTTSSTKKKDGVVTYEYSMNIHYVPLFFGHNTSDYSINAGPAMKVEMVQLPARTLKVNKLSFEDNELPRDFDWKKYVYDYLADLREGTAQLRAITPQKTILAAVEAMPLSSHVLTAVNSLRHDDTDNVFIADNGFVISFSKLVTVPKEEIDQSDPFAILMGNRKTKVLELFFSRDSKKLVITTGEKYGVYIDEGTVIKSLIKAMRESIVIEK